MAEVLEIEQQTPLQEEPPKRKLYNVIVKNKILYVVGKDEIREFDFANIDDIHMISNISL